MNINFEKANQIYSHEMQQQLKDCLEGLVCKTPFFTKFVPSWP